MPRTMSLNSGFRIPNIICSAKKGFQKAGSLKSFTSEVFAFVQRFKPWNTQVPFWVEDRVHLEWSFI